FCKQRAALLKAINTGEAEKTKLLHLVVEGRDLPMYWMHLEMPVDATLADLDDFLRDTWLECCGHLSAIRIGNTSYMSQTQEMMWDMGPAGAEAEVESEEADEEETLEDEDDVEPFEAIKVVVE